MSNAQLVVGLDAGGSTTRVRAEHSALDALVERRGAGANPSHVGLDAAGDVLADLIERAMRDVPAVDRLSICAGHWPTAYRTG